MTSVNQTWIKYLPPLIRTQLEGRHNLQKIIGNTGWLFVDKILRMGVGVVVGVWVARYLGPEQFGLLSYATAFVVLFTPLATLGLDSIVVRDLVNEPADRSETLGTAFVLKLVGGILTLLLTISIALLLRPGDALSHWLIGIIAAGTIFQAFDTIDFWFQSQVQSKYVVIARNISFLLMALARVTLILTRAPLIAFAWLVLAEAALSATGLLLAYHLKGYRLNLWRGRLARVKQLLRESWPLLLSSFAIVIYMKIDQVMLGQMVSDEAVGVYSAAVRVSEVWYFIPMAIVSSVFPSIVEAKKISESLYYQRLQHLFDLMTALSLVIAVPMTFLSKLLIVWLFGQDYAAAGTILAIHIWTAVFVFLGVAQSPWFVTENLTMLAFRRTLAGAIINLALNVVLLPLYSGLGAAIATVISQALAAVFMNLLHHKTRRMFWLQVKSLFFLRHGVGRI